MTVCRWLGRAAMLRRVPYASKWTSSKPAASVPDQQADRLRLPRVCVADKEHTSTFQFCETARKRHLGSNQEESDAGSSLPPIRCRPCWNGPIMIGEPRSSDPTAGL